MLWRLACWRELAGPGGAAVDRLEDRLALRLRTEGPANLVRHELVDHHDLGRGDRPYHRPVPAGVGGEQEVVRLGVDGPALHRIEEEDRIRVGRKRRAGPPGRPGIARRVEDGFGYAAALVEFQQEGAVH